MPTTTLALSHAGADRSCRVNVPSRLAETPGLVVLLHGAVGSGAEFAHLTGFDRESERLGWVAAYPDAWRPGPGGGWDTYACCPHDHDDPGFIKRLASTLVETLGLDPRRVFVAGFSRGGMMAYRLGCELSDVLAGIAAVAGNLADANGSVDAVPCQPSRPIPVIVVHGTSDRNVPVEGGTSPDYPDQVAYASLSDVLRKWLQVNRCSARPDEVSQEGLVTIRRWRGDAPVELRLVVGGGHAWPGPGNREGPDAAFDASRAIADFFSGQTPT